MAEEKKTILLLENVEDDVFVFRRALLATGFSGQVRVVWRLHDARRYMLGEGRFSDRRYFPLPDLIVADFGLNGERGTDFVRWLREHREFHSIPIVFFTGSIPVPQIPEMLHEFGVPVFRKDVDFHASTKTIGEMLKMMSALKVPPLPLPPSDPSPPAADSQPGA